MSGIGRERAPVQEPVPQPTIDEATAVRHIIRLGTPQQFVSWMVDDGDINMVKAYHAIKMHGWQVVAQKLGYDSQAGAVETPDAGPPHQNQSAQTHRKQKDHKAKLPPIQSSHRPKYWADEMIADTGLFTLSGIFWLLNGVFTVIGVASLFPEGIWRSVGALIGLGLHLLISRIEFAYLTRRRIFSPYILVIIAAISVDVSTSHQGLMLVINRFFPSILGEMPLSTFKQVQTLTAIFWAQLWQQPQDSNLPAVTWPLWWVLSVVFGILATVMALGSERAMRYFRKGMMETWRAKYGTA